MKKFLSNLPVVCLLLATALFANAQTPTTQEGSGPTEQPNAPLEIGQPRPQQSPTSVASQPGDSSQPGQPPQMGEAQPGGPEGEGPAKTNQGVGRVSMIHGDVSTQRGDSGTWSAAILNQPVLKGDKVSTGAGGRAEVQLDFANILRLGANAQATIANFTPNYIQIQVGQGLANYTVFGESDAEPEIDTPNVSLHPAHKDGVYRIEVRPDGDSIVIVRKGDAQISTPQGIADIKAGEMATVRGAGADAKYKITPAPDGDDWDRWNAERDHMIHSADAWKHTNKYYVGAEDLDANGRWEDAPEYGQVWVPNEPGDWAPYRDGSWVDEPYYGWTWVGYEPWGWAPYHYGRWMWYGGAWAWWPGPVWGGFYRPFWAPAYVSFYGWGWGWGFGLGWGGWGGFGWLPIGPCDRFFPWWGGYGGRFGVVAYDRFGTIDRFGGIAPLHGGTEFSNVAHINDPHIGGALSTVGAGKFGTGHVTAVAATHEQISGARMMTGNLPVVPTRASLSASGRPAAPSTIHSGVADHFAGTQVSSRPESFQQQTARLQQSMQQNHVASVRAGSRPTASVAESRSTSGYAAAKAGAGASSTGQGGNSNPAKAETSSAANENGNGTWRSFTPRSESEGRASGGSEASAKGGETESYWNRTAPTSESSSASRSESRSASSTGNSERGTGYSRPQLNMRQPIVQPRSSGGTNYGGSHSGASHGAPSGGGHAGGSGGGHSGGGGGHH